MKVLFLIRDLPYPPTTGCQKRNFYLLKELAMKGAEIILFCENSSVKVIDVPAEIKQLTKNINFITVDPKKHIKRNIFSLFSPLPFWVKARTSVKVRNAINDYVHKNHVDMIICDSIYRALNIPFKNTTYKILYEHNIESMIIKRYIETETSLFWKFLASVEFLKLKWFQKKMWKQFDCCVVCSLLDKVFIRKSIGSEKNVCVIGNGVDTLFFNPNARTMEEDTLVYTGLIGWHPNEDAILYFVNNVYPLIKKQRSSIKFFIVGEKPSKIIKELAQKDNSITVTGFVDDVRPYMGKASVFIVPLRIGSGTRLKILEALSMEKAVVSTSVGCEGLEVENNKHLLIRDNPADFAQAVIALLNDENLRVQLGKNGRALVEARYTWDKVFDALSEILKCK